MSKATAADALQMYLDGYTEGEIMEQIGVPPSEYEALITSNVRSIHRNKCHQRAQKLRMWSEIINEAKRLSDAGHGGIQITEK